jgi:peptidoglycan/LPS O-acetylase OafA/YrhL
MLRGIAALLVVIFHYTSRFSEIYPDQPKAIDIHFGHVGVQIFFIISGYVIFMTLDRIEMNGSSLFDFAKARFLRLYPLFWVCVISTFCLIQLLGLPGREVTAIDAIINLTMAPRFLGANYVDGVYWSLEVELLFYVWIALIYRFVPPKWQTIAIACWVIFGYLIIAASAEGLPVAIPRILSVADWSPYFALGIAIYRYTSRLLGKAGLLSFFILCGINAIKTLGGIEITILIATCSMMFIFSTPKWSHRNISFLVWLGTISYPLYLIHQNFGYALLLRFYGMGLTPAISFSITLISAFLAASVLHYYCERPIMRHLRSRNNRADADTLPLENFKGDK